MLNNGGTRYKRSKLERQMNMQVVWCVVILFLMCLVSATGSGLWQVSLIMTVYASCIWFRCIIMGVSITVLVYMVYEAVCITIRHMCQCMKNI